MLLGIMRRQAKSWLIKFLIGIIALVFIFYFGYSFNSDRGMKIAYVNGELISELEYEKGYRDLVEALQKQYKNFWNDDLIKALNLKKLALDNLVDQKLIIQEADRLGLDVTESEVQNAIVNYPPFQINGQFDMERYRALLNNNRMKPEDFEGSIAKELLDKKLKQFLYAFMEVTDQEVLDNYTYDNEKIKISFVRFKSDKSKNSMKSDKASMQEFFEKNKQNYKIPEKLKVAYLEIAPETFREQVEITDKGISDYYGFRMDTFSQPKKVKASHILFKLRDNAAETEESKVRETANRVLEEARQGKDFAALAKKHSEGPTKSKGGDLGYFSAGQMAKPFEDAAFKLKKGEISDLVRSRFGYHIIKVEDIKEAATKTLDEVRDQIVEILTKSVMTDLAHEKTLSLIDQMPYDISLDQYAAQHNLGVEYTDYFSKDEPIPTVGGDEKLRQALFSLEKNEASDLIELNGIFYIFQVADRKASYLPEMEEVIDQVEKDFTSYVAAEKAKAAAESYLAELHRGKGWHTLAKKEGLQPEETGFFTRLDPVPKIGNLPGLRETAFTLNKGKRYPDSVFVNYKDVFVIRWDAHKGINEKKYQKEKQEYRFSLMQKKHGRTYESWLENLRKHAEIEIVTPVDR